TAATKVGGSAPLSKRNAGSLSAPPVSDAALAGCAASGTIAADCTACWTLPPVATLGSTNWAASGASPEAECKSYPDLPCSGTVGSAVFSAHAASSAGACCSLSMLPGMRSASADAVATAFAGPGSEACCELPPSALPPVATLGVLA